MPRLPDKYIPKIEEQRRGSDVVCIVLVVWNDPDCECRLKIVRSKNRRTLIVRWPREMIDNNCVYTFRMRTKEGTEMVERGALAAVAAAGIF